MNKENKKKFYDILNNNLVTPTPQQKQQKTTIQEDMEQQQQHNNNNNKNKKSTYEQQQEQRRRLLEEFKRKKEAEKQNKLNNKMKDKQTVQKKIEEENFLSKRIITKPIKVETKNANAYSSPSSSLNKTPLVNHLSLKKPMSLSSTLSFPSQQSLEQMESFEEVNDNKDLLNSVSINQSTEKSKSKLDNNIKRHLKSSASGKPQGSTIVYNTVNDNSPSRSSSLSKVEHQRVVSFAENSLYSGYSTPGTSPSKASSFHRRFSHKRSPIQPNPVISSFGKAQRMKKDSIENDIKETQIPSLFTPTIYSTPQIPQIPSSNLIFTSMSHMPAKEELSGNNIQRSDFISEYDDSNDNNTSSFEFASSPTIHLPKLKRLTLKRSPVSNFTIASLGKPLRVKIAEDEDNDYLDFPTPKASDYTNNTPVTRENNNYGSKARNFFSVLASTPLKEIIKENGRLLDFSQTEESITDNSFVEQKVDKCVNEFMFTGSNSENLEISGIQTTNDSPKEMSPSIKDVSIQTSPYLLARFLNQMRNQDDLKVTEKP
ncbi:hypothetical protein C1645_249697 [Glomus cerebriforme]|uniref:Uncharacterized protein n=1 Tax=Glomus cerebriforme TaxID=658196 RepID=A0A397THY5_9GLOM|nr:hypothetical protein C1645_249697 [Glomus cerebriforme]